MVCNPDYERIGQAFVHEYYAMFDNPQTRPNLVNFYNAEYSLMSFEGAHFQGSAKIMEKLMSLSFSKIQHLPTKVDCQPMFDGCILISIFGQLKTDDDPPHSFTQNFILKPIETTFFVAHEQFRLHLF